MPGTSEPFAADTGLRRLDDTDAERELGRYRQRLLRDGQVPPRVGHLVPGGYASYCRILPSLMVSESPGTAQARRWSSVLESPDELRPGRLVTEARRLNQTLTLTGGGRLEVVYGFLDSATTDALIGHLSATDAVDMECVYYFWSGRAVVAQRDGHSVYAGPLTALPRMVPVGHLGLETPTAMWPGDMSWCFAMHTDSPAAYLGGSESVIAAIVGDAGLEAQVVGTDDPVDLWPPPPG